MPFFHPLPPHPVASTSTYCFSTRSTLVAPGSSIRKITFEPHVHRNVCYTIVSVCNACFTLKHALQTGSVLVSIGQSYDKLGTDAAAATSDDIEYTYTITNNGLLSLYDIDIEDTGLHEKGVSITCTDVDSSVVSGVGHGAVTGLAAYIDNRALAPAASLTCSATDSVVQAEVRRKIEAPSFDNSASSRLSS